MKLRGASGDFSPRQMCSPANQSLADLGNSMSVVQEMRLFPLGGRDVTNDYRDAVPAAAVDDLLAGGFRDLCDQDDLLRRGRAIGDEPAESSSATYQNDTL